MKAQNLRRQRLANQGIASRRGTTPAQVVSELLALQAQDYAGGLWAIGLRLPSSTLDDVQRAIRTSGWPANPETLGSKTSALPSTKLALFARVGASVTVSISIKHRGDAWMF